LRRVGVTLIVVAVAAGLAAVGAPGRAGAGADARGGPAEPCDLLTVREVEKALGEPVLDGQPEVRALPGTGGQVDVCTWPTEDPDTGVVEGIPLSIVVSVQSGCARPDPAGCFESDEQSKRDESKPIPRPGDDAFYVFTGEVEVLVDDLIVNVHFNSFDTEMYSRKAFERRTVKLAKKAVGRL
jgi:hypothetical protein